MAEQISPDTSISAGTSPSAGTNTVNIGQGARGIIGQTVVGATIVEQQLVITPEAIVQKELIKRSPYKALRRFDVDDADYFFGRYQLTAALQKALQTSNLLLVLGASGSGKSSVVRAKLIPEFLRASSQHHSFVLTPGADPFRSLYESLIGQGKLGPDKDYYFPPDRAKFVLEGRADLFGQIARQLMQPEAQQPEIQWLIVIDQFEELFTRCTSLEQRQRLIQSLTELAASEPQSLKIVLVMRADFLEQFSPYPQFGQRVQRQIHLVTDMPQDELELAIKGPAQKHGVIFEPGLAEQIIQDLQGQAGALPLLQYTLDRLWKYEVGLDGLADRQLNTQNYRQLGQVRGALEQHVNQIYADLDAAGQQAAKSIFLNLVKLVPTDGGVKPVSQSRARSALQGAAVPETLDRLIQENLLVSSSQNLDQVGPHSLNGQPKLQSDQAATIELAHEILLSSWKKLEEWIQEAQEVLLVRSRLVEDMGRWQERQQAAEELLKGSVLAKIVEMQQEHLFDLQAVPLTAAEQAYIAASQQFQKRELNRARRVAIGASVGVGLLAVAMIFSALQMRRAEIEQIQTSIALSKASLASGQELEAQIEILRAGRILQKSFWQALTPQDPLGQAILRQAEAPGQERNRWQAEEDFTGGGRSGQVRFSPDGQQLIILGGEDNLHLWSVAGQSLAQVALEPGTVTFSPDGQQFLLTNTGYELHLWTRTGQRIAQLKQDHSMRDPLAFSPDGQRIASANSEGRVYLWDKTGQRLAAFQGHQTPVTAVAISPDLQRLATAADDGTVRLWDTAGKQLAVIKARGNLLFSPNGKWLAASGGHDGVASIWDVATGQQIALFKGHKGLIWEMQFSPDSLILATLGADGTARLWKSEGRFGYSDNQWVIFTGHREISRMAFSPDGKQMATSGSDGDVRLWDTDPSKQSVNFESGDLNWNPTGSLIALFRGHRGRVNLAFRPDGRQLATLGEDGSLRLWDTTVQPAADPESSAEGGAEPGAENAENRLNSPGKLDRLLARNCDWVRDYLTNSPKVAERDRQLCQ